MYACLFYDSPGPGIPTETDAEIVLIDFQFFGVGNPAWELTYFLLMGAVDPKDDDMLLTEYHSHLIEHDGDYSHDYYYRIQFLPFWPSKRFSRKRRLSSLCVGNPGAAATSSLEQLRNEVVLTMGTMLVQMISESAHPGTHMHHQNDCPCCEKQF